MMHPAILTFFFLFISLLPLMAQEDELPLAYLLRESDTPISLTQIWADNRHDSRYAGSLSGEFGFRQEVSWESAGYVRFGVDFAIGDYALSPDQTRMAFSAYDPTDVTTSNGDIYRGYDYGLFVYHIPEEATFTTVIDRIDIDHPVDVIWSPEGDALLLRAVGIEGLPTPFYSGEEDTLIYDLTAETFYTLQAGDPPVFYTDGYDSEIDVEGQTFYFSAVPPYIWLPDGRIVFQSGGIDCANECRSWNDLYVAERDGSNVERLTVLADQIPLQSSLSIRAAVWSPVDERLYITIDNNDSDNRRSLYSITLDGDFRLEIDGETGGGFLAVQPVVSQGKIYVTAAVPGAGWAIQHLNGDSRFVDRVYQSEADAMRPILDAFTPDGKLAAVNDGVVTKVIDLENGIIKFTLETGVVCSLRWLDEQTLLYQQVQGTYFVAPACPEAAHGLWIAAVSDGSLTNLTERFGQPVRLLLSD